MDPIPSPCIRHCCLNEEDICLGCFRSIVEITGWSQADEHARRLILEAAENRRRQHSQNVQLNKVNK